jgi:hypothetical protein
MMLLVAREAGPTSVNKVGEKVCMSPAAQALIDTVEEVGGRVAENWFCSARDNFRIERQLILVADADIEPASSLS